MSSFIFHGIDCHAKVSDCFSKKQFKEKSKNTDTCHQCCDGDDHKPRQYLSAGTTNRLVCRYIIQKVSLRSSICGSRCRRRICILSVLHANLKMSGTKHALTNAKNPFSGKDIFRAKRSGQTAVLHVGVFFPFFSIFSFFFPLCRKQMKQVDKHQMQKYPFFHSWNTKISTR